MDYLKFENPLNELIERHKNNAKHYKKFVFNGETFSVGDKLRIINRRDGTPYICTVKDLLLVETAPSKFLPAVLVTW